MPSVLGFDYILQMELNSVITCEEFDVFVHCGCGQKQMWFSKDARNLVFHFLKNMGVTCIRVIKGY